MEGVSDDKFSYSSSKPCCGPSFELSRRDGQMRGHNICFYAELTKIILTYHQLLHLF